MSRHQPAFRIRCDGCIAYSSLCDTGGDDAREPLFRQSRRADRCQEREAKLKEATELAEIAKTQAILANESKSSFLANMSHEIRTPLGAILGFADVLKSRSLSLAERNEYLEIITRSGQSLTKIIDDILDLSKIEAGKLEIESLPLALADLCRARPRDSSWIRRSYTEAYKSEGIG
jgi:signal transduction histidine kinase